MGCTLPPNILSLFRKGVDSHLGVKTGLWAVLLPIVYYQQCDMQTMIMTLVCESLVVTIKCQWAYGSTYHLIKTETGTIQTVLSSFTWSDTGLYCPLILDPIVHVEKPNNVFNV